MNTTTRKWTAGSLLALGLCCLTGSSYSADDEDKVAIAKAKEAVLKLTDKAGTPAGTADATKAAKEHKLEFVMRTFKPKNKGGVGIGMGLVQAGHKDSIELLIIDYAKKTPPKGEVDKNTADLVKAAQVSAAVADEAMHQGPAKDVGKKTQAKWKALMQDMQKSSADLIAAAKAKDEKAVGAAAQKLNTSCSECHSIFRED